MAGQSGKPEDDVERDGGVENDDDDEEDDDEEDMLESEDEEHHRARWSSIAVARPRDSIEKCLLFVVVVVVVDVVGAAILRRQICKYKIKSVGAGGG